MLIKTAILLHNTVLGIEGVFSCQLPFYWEEASSNRQPPNERREHILAQTDFFPLLPHGIIITCLFLYNSRDGASGGWERKGYLRRG